MNQQQLISDYIQISRIQLLSLIKIDSRRSHEIRSKIHNEWVKNKKCECCNDELIQSGKCVLTCKHIKAEWGRNTKEIQKRINKKIGIVLLRNLGEAYRLTKIS